MIVLWRLDALLSGAATISNRQRRQQRLSWSSSCFRGGDFLWELPGNALVRATIWNQKQSTHSTSSSSHQIQPKQESLTLIIYNEVSSHNFRDPSRRFLNSIRFTRQMRFCVHGVAHCKKRARLHQVVLSIHR